MENPPEYKGLTANMSLQIDEKYKQASVFLREEILPSLCPMKFRDNCEGASSTPVYEECPSSTRPERDMTLRQSLYSQNKRKETDDLMKDVVSK